MERLLKTFLGACVLLFLAHSPALAMGPIDGEFGILFWQTDTDLDSASMGNFSADDGAPGYRGEVWFFNKFGVRASMFQSEFNAGGPNMDDADYMSADVMYRFFSPTENSFIAGGVGFEDADFNSIDTSGYRLSVEGRFGFLPMLHGYAFYTFMPDLDDHTDGAGNTFTDMSGQEYEFGVKFTFTPFLDARAGYRATNLDFTTDIGGGPSDDSIETAGFMIGMGFHF